MSKLQRDDNTPVPAGPDDALFDWLMNRRTPLRDYEEQFGPLPEGLLKLACDIGTVEMLNEDIAHAVACGEPIDGVYWDFYAGRGERRPSFAECAEYDFLAPALARRGI